MSFAHQLQLATLPLQAAVLRRLLRLPGNTLRKLAGGPRPALGPTQLAPELELLLASVKLAGSPLPHDLSPTQARALTRVSWQLFAPTGPTLEQVQDTCIRGGGGQPMAVRSYVPHGIDEPSPALVLFHGGGWVLGDIETHDGPARCLAGDGRLVVFSIDYRLAPEHPFPAAVEDVEVAFRWVHANAGRFGVDPERIAVGGDSAGGNLAAVLCQQLLRSGGPSPAAQLLLYPGLDFRMATKSMQTFAEGYILERANVDWFRGLYFGDHDASLDPRASPGLAVNLSNLPPAVVATAGYDVLRDEGDAYASALAAAGVAVDHRCYADLIHGFANFAGIVPSARAALREVAQLLRARLS